MENFSEGGAPPPLEKLCQIFFSIYFSEKRSKNNFWPPKNFWLFLKETRLLTFYLIAANLNISIRQQSEHNATWLTMKRVTWSLCAELLYLTSLLCAQTVEPIIVSHMVGGYFCYRNNLFRFLIGYKKNNYPHWQFLQK